MNLKMMWGVIGILAIALLGAIIVIFNVTSKDDSVSKPKTEVKAPVEKSKPVVTPPVPVEEVIHSLGINFTPDVFEYRYNSFFEKVEIDRSIKFEQGVFDNEVVADAGSNATIHAKTHQKTGEITTINLLGENFESDIDFIDYQTALLGFLVAVVDKDMSDEERNKIFDDLQLSEILKNDGENEVIADNIRFTLYKGSENGEESINFTVDNIQNDF